MAADPQKLGKYNIVGKIGKGAMGEVYKGHDPVLNRYVAIKIIAETLGTDSDLVERFKKEARNAAALNHPNIVTIFDFVEEEGHLYMVMELLEGKDLKELIKSGSPLTMDQILKIMEQIADGLGFAHAKGIVHRDLKPANIHLSKNGQVKILDFGLVHEATSDMTKTGQVMGTPNYMSPEQVQGLKVDPRSDIFSLGAVFYELLTRKKPFSADSIHATMFKVVQGDREPLAQYTHLPRPIVSLVDRALDKDPEGRFADANALREHLKGLRREVMKGGDADSTFSAGSEMTIVTPGSESAHPSVPPRSERSVPARSAPGASASGSRGTMRRRELSSSSGAHEAPGRPVVLYSLAAVLVLGVAAGVYFMTRGGGASSGSGSESVEALSQALVASQVELMNRSFEQRDYESALAQAEEVLAKDPSHADALRIQGEARETLAKIDGAVAEARAALGRGDTGGAANALATVLALDPAHPLGVELSSQLDQHFQGQAERARSEMETARSAADAAGARDRAEFQQAERARQRASEDFNRSEFTHAAQTYLEARDLFVKARNAHGQAQAQRQAASQKADADAQQAKAALEARLRQAESSWTRLKQQSSEPGLAQQPSYQRALAEEQVATRLKTTGDVEGAAIALENAASYLERARRELADAEARRARDDETRRAAAATTAATTAPPTTSAPTPAQEEEAIRRVLASYERSLETKDVALFRRVKPNLTAEDEKRLTESFQMMDSQQVEMTIESIAINGDSATVTVTRRDVIVVGGRPQNGRSRQQQFVLSKSSGNWVIVQIG
jgi:serine/threonine protein kinase